MKKTGIRDVAERAGVSLTTVSHVLNGKPHTRVTEKTAERVKSAASELGYIPNRMARGLRNMASDLIGLVAEEIAVTPYAGKILTGAQEEATKHNLTLAIINAELSRSVSFNENGVQALIDRDAEGIIYATVFHDVISASENMLNIPCVLIGATEIDSRIDSIRPDEFSAALEVVKMLHEFGHTKIAYAASSDDVPATNGRILGYLEGMTVAGLSTDNLVSHGEGTATGGYLAANQLLKEKPTAIFCYNDRMAMGVYRAASEAGLRIPQDLSVVGFDDQAPIPEGLYPSLTTVALPHYEMGVGAVKLLLKRLKKQAPLKPNSGKEIQIPCPVVHRDSVARLAPKGETSNRKIENK